MADGQERNYVEKIGKKIRSAFKSTDEIPSGGVNMNLENYIAVAKKEVWFVRYCIAIFLLTFLCYELHAIITTCISERGCKDGMAPWSVIFDGLKSGIFWTFVVIIVGKAIVPIINSFVTWRFGSAAPPPKEEPPKIVTTTTETKVEN